MAERIERRTAVNNPEIRGPGGQGCRSSPAQCRSYIASASASEIARRLHIERTSVRRILKERMRPEQFLCGVAQIWIEQWAATEDIHERLGLTTQ